MEDNANVEDEDDGVTSSGNRQKCSSSNFGNIAEFRLNNNTRILCSSLRSLKSFVLFLACTGIFLFVMVFLKRVKQVVI